ncbi:MAG: cellulase family glycosylhydrolase [Hyphomicrobium sp.]
MPPALIAALATGFNLPNVCDLPPAAAELPGKSLLHDLNALGFRHIRLPIDPTNCVRAERAFVRCLDAVIDRILGAGFCPLARYSRGRGGGERRCARNHPAAGDLIASALRFVAERANDLPTDRVAIELLNEPPLETADWRPLRQRLVREVRAQAPRHTLIWSASRNQTIEETIDDPGPGDRNAVAAVHYYYPMVFTHQGQTWGSTPFAAIKALPFPFSATDVRSAISAPSSSPKDAPTASPSSTPPQSSHGTRSASHETSRRCAPGRRGRAGRLS